MMKEINEHEFIEEFNRFNRSENFTVAGRRALFNYFDEIEGFELDVIAICCEYEEYESVKDYLKAHSTDIDKEDFEFYDDVKDREEEYLKAVLEEIQEKTMVIMVDDESFIIQSY